MTAFWESFFFLFLYTWTYFPLICTNYKGVKDLKHIPDICGYSKCCDGKLYSLNSSSQVLFIDDSFMKDNFEKSELNTEIRKFICWKLS